MSCNHQGVQKALWSSEGFMEYARFMFYSMMLLAFVRGIMAHEDISRINTEALPQMNRAGRGSISITYGATAPQEGPESPIHCLVLDFIDVSTRDNQQRV